mmetsp:Transcript_10403/g.33413  ORF Transcript_10403/g.33413 Transcript_10403/m.33413 type:complete len:248 (-) Transcript_10403:30-773(-)
MLSCRPTRLLSRARSSHSSLACCRPRPGRLLSTAAKPATPTLSAPTPTPPAAGFSYVGFAKAYPFANNVLIATCKTSAADLVAQCAIERKPLSEVDWRRNMVFCLFGAVYLGAFQYWYQVNIFKRLFSNAERFCNLSLVAKLTDRPGLLGLAGQTAIDLSVLSCVYLPTFYVFKAGVFSGQLDPPLWLSDGLRGYSANLRKDVSDVVMVWGPADLVCFSVPMWLRLPVRHVVSFVWTAYLSFVRGSK